MTRASSSSRPAGSTGAVARGTLGLGALGLVALAALGPAGSAAAHDYVIASDPARSSTVSEPLSTASVTFNDVILDLSGTGSSNVLEVTDAAGLHYEDGCSALSGPTISTGVALGAAGDYTMTYQVVSADGHTVSDAIPFTYAPPAGTEEARGASSRPACDTTAPSAAPTDAEATPGPTAGASETPEPEMTIVSTPVGEEGAGASSHLGLVVGIAVAIVVLAVIGVVVVVLTSRRRGDRDPGSDDPEPGQPHDD